MPDGVKCFSYVQKDTKNIVIQLGYNCNALRYDFYRILSRTGKKLVDLYEKGFSEGLPSFRTVTITDNFQVVKK